MEALFFLIFYLTSSKFSTNKIHDPFITHLFRFKIAEKNLPSWTDFFFLIYNLMQMQILLLRSQSAPNMTFLFVDIQYLSCLLRQAWINLQ